MSDMLSEAIGVAVIAHAGQYDLAGEPYILHPLRVMGAFKSETERIVAVLHDVVEDTFVTLESLRDAGFSNEIVEAIDALTKRAGETRMDAAKRAKENKIARAVKLEDVWDNMDLDRLPKLTNRDMIRYHEYRRVYEYLKAPWGYDV